MELYFYKFNIIYIYFELCLVILGFQDLLLKYLTMSDQLPGYDKDNHAHFLHFIDLKVLLG